MSPSPAQLDPAHIRALADQLTRSETGRAVLDGLTNARLGRLGETMGTIVGAINMARKEVRDLKTEWQNSAGAREEMRRIVSALEIADDTILEAVRRLRIMTMGLREGGIDERICTLIDQQLTHVLIACEGTTLSGEDLGRMASKLGALEGSVARLTGARPPRPANDQARERA